MRLGHFLTSGQVKGVKIKYTSIQYQTLIEAMAHIQCQLMEIESDRSKNNHIAAQLQVAVHAELLKRLTGKSPFLTPSEVSFRFKHTEALVFLAIYTQPSISIAYERHNFANMVISMTITALHKNYA